MQCCVYIIFIKLLACINVYIQAVTFMKKLDFYPLFQYARLSISRTVWHPFGTVWSPNLLIFFIYTCIYICVCVYFCECVYIHTYIYVGVSWHDALESSAVEDSLGCISSPTPTILPLHV